MSNILDVTERIKELYRSSGHTAINIEESLFVLDLGYIQADRERISNLLARSQISVLTQGEQTELEQLVNRVTMLDTLQSRARITLKKAGVSRP